MSTEPRLFSEIIHALLDGITRTYSRDLNKLYKNNENEFHEGKEIAKKIEHAIDFVLNITEIHRGPLMRHYNFYSLLLAIIHMNNPVRRFLSLYKPRTPYEYNSNVVAENLTLLTRVLEIPEVADEVFKDLVSATSSYTHYKENREQRFQWFCRALEPNLL